MNFNEQFLEQHLKNSIFYWINDFSRTCFWENYRFFTEQFYLTNDFTEPTILLNELFYWTNYFTEQTILPNERFYWTIVHWES